MGARRFRISLRVLNSKFIDFTLPQVWIDNDDDDGDDIDDDSNDDGDDNNYDDDNEDGSMTREPPCQGQSLCRTHWLTQLADYNKIRTDQLKICLERPIFFWI